MPNTVIVPTMLSNNEQFAYQNDSMVSWKSIGELFRYMFFPKNGPAGLMEVHGSIFRKRLHKGDTYPRWTLENEDIWQFADNMVDELLTYLEGRIKLNDALRHQVICDIITLLSINSPSDGYDIFHGFTKPHASLSIESAPKSFVELYEMQG